MENGAANVGRDNRAHDPPSGMGRSPGTKESASSAFRGMRGWGNKSPATLESAFTPAGTRAGRFNLTQAGSRRKW